MNRSLHLKGNKLKSNLEPIVKIVSIVICIYFILNILFLDTYSLAVYFKTKVQLQDAQKSFDKIVTDNNQLEITIDRLKNDPFYIESIARRDYRMVKTGETVYIFRKD